MRRRTLCVRAAAAVLAVLAGCGGKEPPAEGARAPAVEVDLPGGFPEVPARPADAVQHRPGEIPPAPPPRTDDPAPVPPAEPPLSAARILQTLRADPERLQRELQEIPAGDLADPQARLLKDALAMGLASVLGETARAHEAAREIERGLRPFSPLLIRNLCLTNGTDGGYGNPERVGKAVFKAGDLLNVYYEVDRLSQDRADAKEKEGEAFSCRFDADLRIEAADGKAAWEFEQWEKQFKLRDRNHASGRCHTDFYFHYKGLPLPRQLAPGSYRLVVEFVDLGGVQPRRATAAVPFELEGS